MTMAKRNLVSGSGGPSWLLNTVRCSFLSFLLAVFAYLLAYYAPVLPVPIIKPQFRSGKPPDIPHHHDVETQLRLAPGSYRTDHDARERFKNLSPPRREGGGGVNTVAIVLNWSRFPNVRRITSLLCSSELDSFMKRVLVWNNSPKPLTYLVRDISPPYDRLFSNTVAKDFTPTSCSEEKLEIVNSMENMYFHARFLGCSQSDAEYCFVQVMTRWLPTHI